MADVLGNPGLRRKVEYLYQQQTFYRSSIASRRASWSATFTRNVPPENVGKAVKLRLLRGACKAKRKADSMNSDIVRLCRAAASLTCAIRRSLILRFVFIWKARSKGMVIWFVAQGC